MTIESAPGTIRVEVVYALPDRAWSWTIELPTGATVEQALQRVDIERLVPGAIVRADLLAIFSRPVALTEALRDGDRIEVLRPLQADPKQARRSRAAVSPRR